MKIDEEAVKNLQKEMEAIERFTRGVHHLAEALLPAFERLRPILEPVGSLAQVFAEATARERVSLEFAEECNRPQPPPRKPSPGSVCSQDVLASYLREVRCPLVADIIVERKRIGVEKYGAALHPFNGRNAKIDAIQEFADLLVYLTQRLQETLSEEERMRLVQMRNVIAAEGEALAVMLHKEHRLAAGFAEVHGPPDDKAC